MIVVALHVGCTAWGDLPAVDSEDEGGATITDLSGPGPCDGWTDITLPTDLDDVGDPVDPDDSDDPDVSEPSDDDPWPPSDLGGTGEGDETGDPPWAGPVTMRITEFVSDPDGRDGGAGEPEFVELINHGELPVAFEHLRLQARSWPIIEGKTLALDLGAAIGPGELVVFEWYAEAELVPPPRKEGSAWFIGVSGGSGLRNRDGGILVDNGHDDVADLVQYGGPQPPPFDDPAQWLEDPAEVPGSGRSLCRAAALGIDTDGAGDWSVCEPSPGRIDPPPEPPDDPPPPPEPPDDPPPPPEPPDDPPPPPEPPDDPPPPPEPPDDPPPPPDPPDDPPPPIPAGSLVIVEVLSNPVGPAETESSLEYVEVLNIGTDAVDLVGVTVADDPAAGAVGTDPLTYFGGTGGCEPATCLAPDHRALIVGNGYTGPQGTALVLATDDSTIADDGLTTSEPVVLRGPQGEILSTYRVWADPLAEPYPFTMEVPVVRIDVEGPDEAANWMFGAATPGDPELRRLNPSANGDGPARRTDTPPAPAHPEARVPLYLGRERR